METIEISKPSFSSKSVEQGATNKIKLLPLFILLLFGLLSFVLWSWSQSRVQVVAGDTARSLNEDISVLTASLLAEKETKESDHKVLGELLFLAGHHGREDMSHGARGLLHLIGKVQDERAFSYSRLYLEKYGYPKDRKLGVQLLKALSQHGLSDEQTKAFHDLATELMSQNKDEGVALDLAFYLGRHLVKDYLRRTPKDIVDREITGHMLLVEKVDPLLDEGCDLIGQCVKAHWKGVPKHKLYYWYFESLHALRVHKRQDEAIALFEELVEEPIDEEAMAPVFQLAASLCTLRMRDFDLMGRHRAAERAIPTLKRLVARYGAIHWKTLFETYLLWALFRAQKKEASLKLAEELRPERLALRQRWRYYWVVGEVYKDFGSRDRAIELFKEGSSVATGLAEKKYLARKPHDMWTEKFQQSER